MSKTICLMQCHTNSKLKYDVIEHNVDYISEVCDHLVITNSIEFDLGVLESRLKRFQDKINIEYKYYVNDHTICAGKLYEYLNDHLDFVVDNFDRCIVTNDSFIVINSLIPFKEFILKNEHDLYGILSSREKGFHYPDFLRGYSAEGMKILSNYMKKNLHKCSNVNDVVNIIEINSTYSFDNLESFYPTDLSYKGNLHFDNNILREYVEKLNYPIVKLKYLNRTYYDQDHLPEDFDAFEYRRLHSDLSSLDEISIKRHFLKNGMKEGRKYKKGQKSKCPVFLKDILSKEFPQISSQLTFEDKNV